jgi:hypothetical protein
MFRALEYLQTDILLPQVPHSLIYKISSYAFLNFQDFKKVKKLK